MKLIKSIVKYFMEKFNLDMDKNDHHPSICPICLLVYMYEVYIYFLIDLYLDLINLIFSIVKSLHNYVLPCYRPTSLPTKWNCLQPPPIFHIHPFINNNMTKKQRDCRNMKII